MAQPLPGADRGMRGIGGGTFCHSIPGLDGPMPVGELSCASERDAIRNSGFGDCELDAPYLHEAAEKAKRNDFMPAANALWRRGGPPQQAVRIHPAGNPIAPAQGGGSLRPRPGDARLDRPATLPT